MAICATIETWALVPNVDSIQDCTGAVVLESHEYNEFLQSQMLYEFDLEIFMGFFGFAFSTILTLWLVSLKASKLISIIHKG